MAEPCGPGQIFPLQLHGPSTVKEQHQVGSYGDVPVLHLTGKPKPSVGEGPVQSPTSIWGPRLQPRLSRS